MRLLFAFLLTLLALPAAEPLYDQKNLAAWCIVPFDNQKRTPEQRAAMVAKMGLPKVAYDWRQALGGLPVAALRLEPEAAEGLVRLGLRLGRRPCGALAWLRVQWVGWAQAKQVPRRAAA